LLAKLAGGGCIALEERPGSIPFLSGDHRLLPTLARTLPVVLENVSGKAVLAVTGWSIHWRTGRYFENNPYLTAGACELLAARGARFVGIDSLNIDDVEDLSRPAHTLLLGAGIPICEHMTNLGALPPEGGFLHAVPIAWAGGATFPVRAYAVYPDAR